MSEASMKTQARYSIMNNILSYPSVGCRRWSGEISGEPKPGDLVALCSAPPDEWYLSWYLECLDSGGMQKHLIESVETGRLAEYGNVSLAIYDREEVACHPEWRWTDRQFAFRDRWIKTCYRTIDNYPLRPNWPVFSNGASVRLALRKHIWQLDNDWRYEETFDDWRRVTKKMMAGLAMKALAAKDAPATDAPAV